MWRPLAALFLSLNCCARPQPSNDTVFVSNEAGYVTMVDGATGRIEGKLATGARPRGMAFSPDGRTFYVAASDSGRIEAWDSRGHDRVAMYDAGSDPERFAVSPDGSTFYIASEDHSAVTFTDLKTGKIIREVKVGPEPEGVGVSPDGKLVVATSESRKSRALHRHGDRQAARQRSGRQPPALRPVPQSRQDRLGLVRTARDDQHLRRRDTPDRPHDRSHPELQHPRAGASDRNARHKDEKRVFVAMGRSNRVAEIDPATDAVVRSFPTGERTWGIGLSPDETRLYAASGLSGTLTIIDIVHNKVLKTVPLGGRPWGAMAARK